MKKSVGKKNQDKIIQMGNFGLSLLIVLFFISIGIRSAKAYDFGAGAGFGYDPNMMISQGMMQGMPSYDGSSMYNPYAQMSQISQMSVPSQIKQVYPMATAPGLETFYAYRAKEDRNYEIRHDKETAAVEKAQKREKRLERIADRRAAREKLKATPAT